jgi:hypothetical protein
MKSQYADFDHRPADISAFLYSRVTGVFSISLRTGQVIHFQPKDPASFHDWLKYWGIRDASLASTT